LIIDLLIGEPVSADYLLEDLLGSDIIFVGESHTIDRHHTFQKKIIKELSDRGANLAVGMEMFQADQQGVLDKWISGKLDINHLKYLLGDYWTNLEDYGEILLALRELEIPLVALNAKDSLVKSVARKGLDGLSEKEAGQTPKGTREINPKNAKLLSMKLKVHKAFQNRGLERIIQAQALRDQTMAENIVDFMKSPEGRARKMLVIVGSGHLNYGFGIPERTRRLMDCRTRIVLPSQSGELELTKEQLRQAVQVDITHSDLKFIDKPIADYLMVTPLKKDPAQQDHAPGAPPDLARGLNNDPIPAPSR
jgi:uncharacterized iron-regulated protein